MCCSRNVQSARCSVCRNPSGTKSFPERPLRPACMIRSETLGAVALANSLQHPLQFLHALLNLRLQLAGGTTPNLRFAMGQSSEERRRQLLRPSRSSAADCLAVERTKVRPVAADESGTALKESPPASTGLLFRKSAGDRGQGAPVGRAPRKSRQQMIELGECYGIFLRGGCVVPHRLHNHPPSTRALPAAGRAAIAE